MKVKRAIDQGKSAFGGKKEEEESKDMEDGEEKKKKMTRGKNAPTKFFRGAQEEALSEMPEKKATREMPDGRDRIAGSISGARR